jgi:hypothetical protein
LINFIPFPPEGFSARSADQDGRKFTLKVRLGQHYFSPVSLEDLVGVQAMGPSHLANTRSSFQRQLKNLPLLGNCIASGELGVQQPPHRSER